MTDLPTKSKTNYGLIKSDKKIFSPYVKNVENFEIAIFRQFIFLISDFFPRIWGKYPMRKSLGRYCQYH